MLYNMYTYQFLQIQNYLRNLHLMQLDIFEMNEKQTLYVCYLQHNIGILGRQKYYSHATTGIRFLASKEILYQQYPSIIMVTQKRDGSMYF